MSKVIGYVLRFGPLAAAFALGLAAVIEPFVPGYSGILGQILGVLALVGVQPDQAVVEVVGSIVGGVLLLQGFARKLYRIIKAQYFTPIA